MKIKLLTCLLCCIMISVATMGQSNPQARKNKIELFPLNSIRITGGEFKTIQDLQHKYLLSLQPNRLLSLYRTQAGLQPKDKPYPCWESEDVWGGGPLTGHILGFYLSSMSMMYQSTNDKAILDSLDRVLDELMECQKAGKDGYLLATMYGRDIFEAVVSGNFETDNALIKRASEPIIKSWEPVYVMNKVMLGLHSVYTLCGREKARTILIKMADWFGTQVIDRIGHDDMQKLLVCEHGSINESYVQVYELTGDVKYLKWAERLNDEKMLIPLSEHKDILNGWHANTQIPKFTGFEAIYRYSGDKKLTDAAKYFWEIVINNHTWVTGGNSQGEYFFKASEFEKRVERIGGPESCNSINLMRLTESLYRNYGGIEKINYYEKVLFNHILANYEPSTGMCTYFTSMRPGHYKVYGTPYESFWCCTGTGMEAPAKFGQMIYAHTSDTLLINVFIPSAIDWKEKGLSIEQQTQFPDKNSTSLVISNAPKEKISILIRHPYWSNVDSSSLWLNNKPVKMKLNKEGYLEIKNVWKKGDRITLNFSPRITVDTLGENSKYIAFSYGPIVLGAKIDNHGLRKDDFFSACPHIGTKEIPVNEMPYFYGPVQNLSSNIIKQNTDSLKFKANDIASNSIELVPFYRIHYSRYALYFCHYTNYISGQTR